MSRARELGGSLVALLLLSSATPRRAAAYAEFEIMVADDANEGFNDPTEVEPVGGNTGTTLGAQRLQALERAAALWGEVLDSDVVIRIEATFDPIPCVGGVSTTLAYGGTTYLEYLEVEPGGEEHLVPTALADRVLDTDMRPGQPDISIQFNSNLDSGTCLQGTVWYYGLDAAPGDNSDMIDTALHEIGHGLGMQSMYEEETGNLIANTPSAYMTHVLDLDTDKYWDEMTPQERLISQVNARRVVWDGEHANAASDALLESGRPSVHSDQVPDLSGFYADVGYGTWSVATTVSAELAVDTTGLCPPPNPDGRIALMTWECAHSTWAAAVERDGAIAIVVESPGDWNFPVSPLDEHMPVAVGIPVVAISTNDMNRLVDAALAGTVMVEVSIDEDARLGGDDEGRVMLNITSPLTSSSIAHFEPLARPNLLMEPVTGPRTLHDLDLAPAVLHDLGWEPFCGNGEIDQDEECDEGDDNSDTEPDACRVACIEAACGDGVTDDGEACDDGDDNSDTAADACRTTCEEASCGDGVVDEGEACDDGDDNSDSMANACRTTCTEAACGDGVQDTGEACDDGASNSDTAVDACRVTCDVAACGDGVIDEGETCDEGAANSDTAADACRESCEPASCGDGVLDMGEVCDPGTGNPCNSDCSSDDPDAPPLGDGGVRPTGDGGDEGGGGGGDDGCGCRAVGGTTPRNGAVGGLLALAALCLVARRAGGRRALA